MTVMRQAEDNRFRLPPVRSPRLNVDYINNMVINQYLYKHDAATRTARYPNMDIDGRKIQSPAAKGPHELLTAAIARRLILKTQPRREPSKKDDN
jgi:hypothetical protein